MLNRVASLLSKALAGASAFAGWAFVLPLQALRSRAVPSTLAEQL